MAVNDTILDASILHETRLEKLKNNIVNRSISILKQADTALFAELTKQLEILPKESFTVQRLEALLVSVRDLNAQAYSELSNKLNSDLKEFTEYELDYQYQLFRDTIPVQVSLSTVSAEQVYTAAFARPFQGVLLKEALDGVELDKAVRIRNAVRIGYVNNQTISQIVTTIRGTRALNYKDGLLEQNRSNVESIVRTAVSHFSAFSRKRFMEANRSVLKGEQYLSVLDTRTTPRCQSLSGKVYPVGEGIYPPQHWNCRSVRVAVTKSWRELGFDVDEIPLSTQASMDGQVPSNWDFNDWLKRQSLERQEEVLGVTRAKLYRAGDLPVKGYINNKGEYYTLKQLKQKDAELFKKAGL